MKKSIFVRLLLALIKPTLLILLVASIFSIIWLRSSVISLEYSISSLEKKKEALLKEQKQLTATLANLKSMERIEKVSWAQFTLPDRMKVVVIKKASEPNNVAVNYSTSK